jgi:hypothetical protein
MISRLFVLACAALSLAACNAPQRTMTVAQLGAYRIADIHVTLSPGVSGRNSAFETSFAQSRGAVIPVREGTPESTAVGPRTTSTDYFAIISSPEALRFYEHRTVELLRAEMAKQVGHALLGQRPARIEVTVTQMTLPNEAMRILVSQHHQMKATITLRDAVSGQALVVYPDMVVLIDGGGGLAGTFIVPALLGGPVERLGAQMAANYRSWLLQN